jgi:hypothetical protein
LVLGLVLMLTGFQFSVPTLWLVGVVLALGGGILWLAERSGAAWGRRWY